MAELDVAGYDAHGVENVADVLVLSERYVSMSLLLLDVEELGPNLGLIAAIRRKTKAPIIVLSTNGEMPTKIRAFELGADDYVVKPFSTEELLARIRVHLRRTSDGERPRTILEFRGLTLDRECRRVMRDGSIVRLTPTEFAILEFFTSQIGKPVTIRQLIGRVWRGEVGTTPGAVRVHISSLRRKIEPDPSKPRYIITEPWVGYRFVAEPFD